MKALKHNFIHKIKHWEYWPVYLVYFPSFLLWIGFAIKFRSITFFKYANPGIKNGGLFGDSKFEIYQLLPPYLYPKTCLIKVDEAIDFQKIIIKNSFNFPLYVKPDVGLRGIGVQKVFSINDLHIYHQNNQNNFLVQESIDFPNEIGLFYCRKPHEINGKVTGITVKKFLSIEGNGEDNIEDLLNKVPRFRMQIPKLKDQINLSEVLKKGEKRCLVPYGNHNRGTEFLDGKLHITQKLEQTFDEILKKVPGFYFGRLDISFNSFEELEQGINFSIIEINGVKSEPTHIYDAKHSFFYGQKEIFKHQMLMFDIIKINLTKSL